MKFRFSVSTLLLAVALSACILSHIFVSRELAATREHLTNLRNDALILDVDDDSLIYALALPNYGDLQWRWKIQLPTDGQYRLRYSLGKSLPENLPKKSLNMDAAFLGSDAKPLPGGTPFVLDVSISKFNEKWQITANNGERVTGVYLRETPTWLEPYSAFNWATSISGKGQTDSSNPNTPLQLLQMCRAKLAQGGLTVDPASTQGVSVWIERIEQKNAR